MLVCISSRIGAQISLAGTVTGSDNGVLTGAHVTLDLDNDRTSSDENGKFSFSGIRPGKHKLKVSYIGFETFEVMVDLRKDTTLRIFLKESATVSDAVIVSAVRASQNTPTTYTTISKDEISRNNTAQDMPYMLSHEPSVVTTSDAGAGVGYTGLRIRGSDITRINVTINGIPLNDPESHAVYWVDIPDFASSVNSLQLQRGVGSSTNGAGAFGASMNIETNAFQAKPFGIISLGAGSFNTWKTSFQAGTGLIKDHWYFEGRGSALGSDGYIDRATSDLNSFFLQGGYYDEKNLIKMIAFGGKERTYQAWYGIDAYTMETDRTFNWAGAIFNEDGSISYYDNQTDNYSQNHYQLHVSRRLSKSLNMNLSGHYTAGAGYYEEYRQDDDLEDYGISNLVSDLIRRRWLDNHYYGITWSLRYLKSKTDLIIGGAFNKYDKARHFGEIIWSEFTIPKDYEYYNNTSFKTDFNVFAKAAWTPVESLTLYADVQYRTIGYENGGIESHLKPIDIDETFRFLNPKVGISYTTKMGTAYISYSIAHREPIRDDYIDAIPGEHPKPEFLGNLEVGLRKAETNYHYNVNYFLMNYRNQLVLTGEINDDGAYIRRNAGKSYRSGVEMMAGYKPVRFVEVAGNMSLSINKTDYKQPDEEGGITKYNDMTISFSPSVIGGAQVRIFPFKNMEAAWLMKYVGKQYLDNTGNESLTLDSYFINDARFIWAISTNKGPDVEFSFTVNNFLNAKYESNGFVYDKTPYYYPQAGTHFMAGINIKF